VRGGSRITPLLCALAVSSWNLSGAQAETMKSEAHVTTTAISLAHIRGVVKATAQATLASQIAGRINQLPYKEGQRFKKDAVLVGLDCAKYKAELAGATAEFRAKQKTYQNNLRMEKLQAVGQLDVEVSQAEAEKAEALMRAAQVIVNGCVIRAPFPGRVTKVLVNEHENIAPADQLLNVIDDEQLEIELIVPSKALTWLKVGTSFQFDIDETGKSHTARVQEIGASVDTASQTIKVKGLFPKLPSNVLVGMSGTATFPEVHE
jgi:membrane fusion protein, multidrug efflux system